MIRRIRRFVLRAVVGLYVFWISALAVLRFVDPPTTGVQMQRRVESWFSSRRYEKQSATVPMARIALPLRHAVMAAEDTRFYEHFGLDVVAMWDVAKESTKIGRVRRGGSTITQQLVKNLFFTTHGFFVRKLVEWTLAPVAEVILGKERILELYLNVIEWGPGVYGAEAAARYHYGVSAAALTREQALRLAACIPAPRRRRPAMMGQYAAIIERRMRALGY